MTTSPSSDTREGRTRRERAMPVAAAVVGGLLVFAAVGGSGGGAVASPEVSDEPVAAAAADAPVPAEIEGPREATRIAHDGISIPEPIGDRGPTTVELELETTEREGQLADGTTYTYWTFNDTVPGPMLRVREGDTVELTLKNADDSVNAHSIDLHAVNGPGGGAEATQTLPGEENTFTFQALSPGVYVYHCATAHIPTHVAMGMYGLIVVEPEGGLEPVDREFYVMQGEIYAQQERGTEGLLTYDTDAMMAEDPTYVVWNGAVGSLTEETALQAEVGETVRIFLGNGGPNMTSSVHLIGEIFDRVSVEGGSLINEDVQTTLVAAGGATWVEFEIDVPGDYILVDHALTRAIDGGAVAIISATGDEDPTIFHGPGGSGGSGH